MLRQADFLHSLVGASAMEDLSEVGARCFLELERSIFSPHALRNCTRLVTPRETTRRQHVNGCTVCQLNDEGAVSWRESASAEISGTSSTLVAQAALEESLGHAITWCGDGKGALGLDRVLTSLNAVSRDSLSGRGALVVGRDDETSL